MVRRIEISGALATGKSTLAAAFRPFGFDVVGENFSENPFFRKSYGPLSRHLDIRLAFLTSHAAAIENYQGHAPAIVCDYALLGEHAYADARFKKDTPALYEILNSLTETRIAMVGKPDLIVHLHCSAETQLQRVKSRERDFEQELEISYLELLNEAFEQSVRSKVSDPAAVMRVDTDQIDLQDKNTIQALAKTIADQLAPVPA